VGRSTHEVHVGTLLDIGLNLASKPPEGRQTARQSELVADGPAMRFGRQLFSALVFVSNCHR
jgi:hypothetical protein